MLKEEVEVEKAHSLEVGEDPLEAPMGDRVQDQDQVVAVCSGVTGIITILA